MNTSTPASASDLLTYEEAAALLGIQRAAVQTAIANGKLHPIKLPGSARKYLERADVLSYPDRRNAPVERRDKSAAPLVSPTPASPSASETLDPGKLRELATALSGPTIEALRLAQETSQRGIDNIAQIAFAIALGASGVKVIDPKA